MQNQTRAFKLSSGPICQPSLSSSSLFFSMHYHIYAKHCYLCSLILMTPSHPLLRVQANIRQSSTCLSLTLCSDVASTPWQDPQATLACWVHITRCIHLCLASHLYSACLSHTPTGFDLWPDMKKMKRIDRESWQHGSGVGMFHKK
jgi:hypothetical protein